jgi:hypothetical protein
MSEARTHWRRTFAAARADRGWLTVPRIYTERSARQIAIDIRCAAHRAQDRVQGIIEGERWEARWRRIDFGAPGDCIVEIRLAHHE